MVDGQVVGRSLTLEPRDGNLLSWNGSYYRGGIRLLADGNDFKSYQCGGFRGLFTWGCSLWKCRLAGA